MTPRKMRPILTWLLLGLTGLLAPGCGSTKTTLAQDLAWERWAQCSSRHSSISLHHIDPDGRVWVTYNSADHRLAFNAWDECMRNAFVEQGRKGATGAAPPVAVALPSSAEGLTQAPRWNIGDEWAYRYERAEGTGTTVWSVARIEPLEGEPHYVIKAGAREIFYRVTDFAFTRETASGKIVRASRPSQWRWVDFPLAVGKSWEMKWSEERPVDQRHEDVERRCVAERQETVAVPAGTFETIRVDCYNKRDGAKIQTFWYAPSVRLFVRAEFPFGAGRELRELIKYRLR